jgi:hypothetical protein
MAPVYPFFDGAETVRAAEALATLDVDFTRAAFAPHLDGCITVPSGCGRIRDWG